MLRRMRESIAKAIRRRVDGFVSEWRRIMDLVALALRRLIFAILKSIAVVAVLLGVAVTFVKFLGREQESAQRRSVDTRMRCTKHWDDFHESGYTRCVASWSRPDR